MGNLILKERLVMNARLKSEKMHFLHSALFIIVSNLICSTLCQADTEVTVTITQRAPIEMVSASGEIAGVKEGTVGEKMVFVSLDGSQVTLHDAGGNRYRIALGATDYLPLAMAKTSEPTNGPAQAIQTTTSLPPVPPAAVSLNPTNTAPPAALSPAAEQGPVPTGAVTTVPIDERKDANMMAVWPPGGMMGRPLLIAAHGNGGSGPKEIKGWMEMAQQHRFTIVCPTFLSSVNAIHLAEDQPYFEACLHWIGDHLQYDKANVYMTGFSGGGFPTWYLATQRPDFFHGIFLQSGNFCGDYFGLDLDKWYNKPIKIIWGSQDKPDIPIQASQAVDALKAADCKKFTTEVVQGGHHQPHHDLVISWMEQQVSATPSN
jgi:poly(3-hydroxybutyrate) depolymerase